MTESQLSLYIIIATAVIVILIILISFLCCKKMSAVINKDGHLALHRDEINEPLDGQRASYEG